MPCTAYVGYRRCGVDRSSRGSTQQQKRTGEEKRREEKRRDDGTRCRTVKYHPRGTRAGPSLSNSSLSSAREQSRAILHAAESARAWQPVPAQFCFKRPTHPPSHHTRTGHGTGTYRAAAAAATTRSASSARSPGSRVTSSSSSHAGDDASSDEDDGDGSSDARAMVEPSGQHRRRAHSEQQSRRQQRQHNVSV